MITKEQALTLRYRQELHHAHLRNSDGSPLRARVNGATQTWKREPARFHVPCKYGLKTSVYVTETNAHEWCLTAEEAVEAGKARVAA